MLQKWGLCVNSVTEDAVPGGTLIDPLISNEAFDRDKDQRLRVMKWNGWGFLDTRFKYDPFQDLVTLTGNRFKFSSAPKLRGFLKEIGLEPLSDRRDPQTRIFVPQAHRLPPEFLQKLAETAPGTHVTTEDSCRLFHSHGHTAQEIYTLRYGYIIRVVDAVVYPSCEEDVCTIAREASAKNVVIIPFGGGTSVTMAVLPPPEESRPIVSVDMFRLADLEWIDDINDLACIQAGATGQEIERMLSSNGWTLGHEPDSHEFSTLGGWIATRASGMKKNRYGNIEDILVDVSYVRPDGTLVGGNRRVSRVSSGPDIKNMILGSEGTLGVITKAVVKIRRLPANRSYESFVFRNLDDGLEFMYDISRQDAKPASLR